MTDDPSDFISQSDRLFNQGNYQAADLAGRNGQTTTELKALSGLTVRWGNLGDLDKMFNAATRLLTRARLAGNRKYEMDAGLRLATALTSTDLPTRRSEIRQVAKPSHLVFS